MDRSVPRNAVFVAVFLLSCARVGNFGVGQALGRSIPIDATQDSLFSAEEVMHAFEFAYSGAVTDVCFSQGDWAATVNGQVFYYAEGRLLPATLRGYFAEYSRQPFYKYVAGISKWRAPTPEEAERYRNAGEAWRQNPPKRSQHFFDALWRAGSRAESYERVKSIKFLGRSVFVHYAIMEELALVEERILKAAEIKPEVKRWIDGLDSVVGWNWRNIAETESRSYHAYGAAIDLLPKKTSGYETYWLWTREHNKEWWAVPYSERLHPPAEVVSAFESYGFIWGGNWVFYDTMHFEYRPEILYLNHIDFDRSW
jgi:hypothetical protein